MDLGLPEPGRASHRPSTSSGLGPLPEVRDVTGYRLDARPLAMSGVSIPDLTDAITGVKPLGFPSIEVWEQFQTELCEAFQRAGLGDAATRLGGSSRSFFSSPYTRTMFPQNLRELRAQIVAKRGGDGVTKQEIDAIYFMARARYIHAGFLGPGPKPGKHFWDSRYMFGIDTAPCDYDIEVASDFLDNRMRLAAARWRADNLGKEEMTHVGSSSQWREALVLREFPELLEFKDRWQAILGRPVDFECFDGHERLRFAARSDWWHLRGME